MTYVADPRFDANGPALVAMLGEIVADNRAGGPRELEHER